MLLFSLIWCSHSSDDLFVVKPAPKRHRVIRFRHTVYQVLDKAPDKVLCSPVEGSQPMETLVLIDDTEAALWQNTKKRDA